ncbi:hypothetical protein BDW27_101527 [Nocardiopsis sp. L17-MgMaSL7]|nr:hypothetical protein BDW27_101527 [Nocardiopsis sp. L17-MgMaSL7]
MRNPAAVRPAAAGPPVTPATAPEHGPGYPFRYSVVSIDSAISS